MSYSRKDLKQQLIEFAARKAVAKAVDMAAHHGAKSIQNTVEAQRIKRAFKPKPKNRKYHNMSFNDSGLTEPVTRNQSRRASQRDTSYNRDEPVELWVNTVIVKKHGDEPIRLLSGRPLRAFNADKDVTTNNEEFNQANAVANAFVTMMKEDADELQLGESRYYGPGGNSAGEDLAPGIYFQLHRTMADAAADAATKADLEAAERDSLRNLFG